MISINKYLKIFIFSNIKVIIMKVKMNYKFYKEQLILKTFILFLFLFKLYYNECLINSLIDLNYPRVFILENDYILMVTTKGIYSFNQTLDNIIFSYNFTDDQKMTEIKFMDNNNNTNNKIDSIIQVEISQFTEGDKYVICLANKYLYLLTNKGQLLYNKKLSDLNSDYSINLIAYKFSGNNYYFIIAFNYYLNDGFNNKNVLHLRYYQISIDNNQNQPNNKYEIQLINSINLFPLFTDLITLSGLSCQIINSYVGKYLACFEIVENFKRIELLASNPDNNYFLMPCFFYDFTSNKNAIYIKTSLNADKTKVLICFTTDILKCIYFDVNLNLFYDITNLKTDFCNINYFGFNLYYFNKANENVLTCISTDKSYFDILRLNENFEILNNDNNTFSNCISHNIHSLIYISEYRQYSAFINSNCEGKAITIYLLSTTFCILQE